MLLSSESYDLPGPFDFFSLLGSCVIVIPLLSLSLSLRNELGIVSSSLTTFFSPLSIMRCAFPYQPQAFRSRQPCFLD